MQTFAMCLGVERCSSNGGDDSHGNINVTYCDTAGDGGETYYDTAANDFLAVGKNIDHDDDDVQNIFSDALALGLDPLKAGAAATAADSRSGGISDRGFSGLLHGYVGLEVKAWRGYHPALLCHFCFCFCNFFLMPY